MLHILHMLFTYVTYVPICENVQSDSINNTFEEYFEGNTQGARDKRALAFLIGHESPGQRGLNDGWRPCKKVLEGMSDDAKAVGGFNLAPRQWGLQMESWLPLVVRSDNYSPHEKVSFWLCERALEKYRVIHIKQAYLICQ